MLTLNKDFGAGSQTLSRQRADSIRSVLTVSAPTLSLRFHQLGMRTGTRTRSRAHRGLSRRLPQWSGAISVCCLCGARRATLLPPRNVDDAGSGLWSTTPVSNHHLQKSSACKHGGEQTPWKTKRASREDQTLNDFDTSVHAHTRSCTLSTVSVSRLHLPLTSLTFQSRGDGRRQRAHWNLGLSYAGVSFE